VFCINFSEPPVINIPPVSTVVSAEDSPDTVQFTCEAVGSDTPDISWVHDGKDVADFRTKYIVSPRPSVTSAGRRVLSSTLTILDVEAQDTGTVVCVVYTSSSPATNNMQLPGDTVEVPLTVLGEWFTPFPPPH
jgi:hypothetical protein